MSSYNDDSLDLEQLHAELFIRLDREIFTINTVFYDEILLHVAASRKLRYYNKNHSKWNLAETRQSAIT